MVLVQTAIQLTSLNVEAILHLQVRVEQVVAAQVASALIRQPQEHPILVVAAVVEDSRTTLGIRMGQVVRVAQELSSCVTRFLL